MLPLLNDEWNKLCFYNFKTVNEYATKLYSIASELSWCGRKLSESEKIEKTLTTFSPAERILCAQYRRMNHDTFDKLVATLLLEEKHGLLLQRNHDERRLPDPPSHPKPEANYGDGGHKNGNGGKPKHLRGKKAWKQKGKQPRIWNKNPKYRFKGRNVRHNEGNGRNRNRERPGSCLNCGDTDH